MILAGGSGTRLWPLARAATPKPFVALDQGRSLFRRTLERIAPVVGWSRIVVVTGSGLVRWVREQAPEIPADRILSEGLGRDTAASVAIAALWMRARFGDAIMVVLPADHSIQPAAAFRTTVRRAIAAARTTRRLVTIGAPARRAEPHLGYIRPGRRVLPGVREVSEFVEKPSSAWAARMVRSGRYLWNTGIFVWSAGTILAELDRHRRDVLTHLAPWARAATRRRRTVPAAVMRRVPRIPVDRAVLERTRALLVLRASFEWSDVGTWDTYPAVLGTDRAGNSGTGRFLSFGARRCLAVNDAGLTVFVEVSDVAAVRSGDVVLICHRSAASRVRDVVRALRGRLAVYR